MFKHSQKGVSLIITFFISIIILFIVLSISMLLYSEIKIIRNIGNSVAAFYTAESGVEKVLYYDRKNATEQGRGICSICEEEVDCDFVGGLDCAVETCLNCQIELTTTLDDTKDQKYDVDISVDQQCKISLGTISSYGYYEKASRAIRLDSAVKVSSLVMSNPGATITAQGKVTITVTVLESPGVETETVIAAIYGLGEEKGKNCEPECDDSAEDCCMYREIILQSGGDGTWSMPWNYGTNGVDYIINVMAWDNLGYCVEVSGITATPI